MPQPANTRRLAAALAATAAASLVTAASSVAVANDSDGDGGYFVRVATFPAYLNTAVEEETVAEISTVTADGNTVIHTDAAGGGLGFVDITDPSDPQPAGYLELGDGEPTSVYATSEHLLAVVDTSAGYVEPSGELIVFDINAPGPVAEWEPIRVVDLGGQPDSIDVTGDGETVVIAIENQRDEDLGEGGLPQAPAGTLAVVDLHRAAPAWKARHIALDGLADTDTPADPEPEYVAIAPDDRHVAVTLQENNAVAIVDLQTKKVRNHFSAGAVTIGQIDAVEEDIPSINLTDTIPDVPREPDAIAWIDGDHVATANEGDWKGGSRGWTIFDAATGAVVWDSGNAFEHLTVSLGQYPEHRSENKGAEPEGIAAAVFDGVPYVFVAAERANLVAVYDVSDPTAPVLTQALSSTAGPEGLLAIPSRDLLVVSAEEDSAADLIRATVQLYELDGEGPAFPALVSAEVDGAPIGWGALSALSADPVDPNRLYTSWDSFYAPSTILSIDLAASPATIDATLPLTLAGGAPAHYDVEGLWAKPGGGFWLGVEGRDGATNLLVEVDAAGVVVREVSLPDDIQPVIGRQGIEGVTGTADGSELYVALQRNLAGDPADVARIGRYDVVADTWSWFGYPLETTTAPGDWIGLSEVVLVGPDTLAVIERDKLNGPEAAIKRIYTVEVPAALAPTAAATLPVAAKSLAYDVLPDMAALNGWTQEKLEGMAVAGNGNVYVVVDNDGIDDANGENVFLDLGSAAEVFAEALGG